jgi:hypothetical protein
MNFTIWYSCLTFWLQLTQGSLFWPCRLFNDPVYRAIQSTLTVATDCTISFCARSNSKVADLRKRGATEVHFIAAQKFLLEVSGLSSGNVDNGVCVTRWRAVDSCRYLKGLLVAGSKTYCVSWHQWFSRNWNLSLWFFLLPVVTCEFYGRLYSRTDTNLLHICPSVCLSACISAAFIGEIYVWYFIGDRNGNISR